MRSRVCSHIRIAGSGLLSAVLVAALATSFGAAPASATGSSGSIVVDPSVAFQTIQGWGTSLAWWAEGAGGWTTANRQALDSALFGLNPGGTGLGLNVVRFDIGASTPTDATHPLEPCAAYMRVGAAQPSFDTIADAGTTGGGAGSAPGTDPTSSHYNWANDPNQVAVLKDAQAYGANVFAAEANSAPASMTKDNCSGGSNDTVGTDNLDSSNYQAYADYISTVVKHFHDTTGIPFSTVDPLNEPAKSGWNSSTCVQDPPYPKSRCQQGMVVSTSGQASIVSDLASDLSGVSYTHISGPDELNVAGSIEDYNSYSSSQQAALSLIDTHNYGDWGSATESGTPAYLFGQRVNKPVWMSEWGASTKTAASSAVTLSQEIVKNENEMHPSAWVIWQAADGQFAGQTVDQNRVNGGGNPNDVWGLADIDYSAGSDQSVRYPLRYWVMGNYSEFVRPGYRMIQNSDPNTFTAWDQATNKLVIVTTNPLTASTTRSFDLSKFGLSGATVAAYQSAAAPNGGSEEHLQRVTPTTFSTSTATLSDTVPASSVTTYVVSGASYTGAGASTEADDSTTGTGSNQWNYTGATWAGCTGAACGTDYQSLYNGTNHWDWTANDTAKMTFTGGRVRLYGVTDTGEGRATVSVDGGAATELDFYAASRHDDQLMWESPQLGSGSHTLTVTVSGSKNPQSTGTLIALDRAEVDPLTTTVDDGVTGSGSNQWSYGGSGWVHCANSSCADPNDMYANTASWDASVGDTATLTFSGTSVTLYGMTDNNEGIATVSVDGGTPKTVDFYSPTRVLNAPVFGASGLSNSSHTLTLTVTNQRDAESGGTVPVIDRAVVGSLVPANPAALTSVDDRVIGSGTNQWSYSGTGWGNCSGSGCGDPQDLYGGTTTWDGTAFETATFTVNATASLGTTVKLYGVTDINEGKADVSVDGGTPTTVDFYSSPRQGDHVVWTSANLGIGTHTVTVKVDGTRNPSSSGYLVALDRATIGSTQFVSALTDGTARNDFAGGVGMQFTTGSSGLVVTAVGREKVSGNVGSHPVAIYRASDGVFVAGASVNTGTAAVDAQGFQYAALAQPVTLAANTTYYLVSKEWSGSDQWYHDDSTVTLTGGGTISPVYVTWAEDGTATWTPNTSAPGQTYGPVSLLTG